MNNKDIEQEIKIKQAELLLAGWTVVWSHSNNSTRWRMPDGTQCLWQSPLESLRRAHDAMLMGDT